MRKLIAGVIVVVVAVAIVAALYVLTRTEELIDGSPPFRSMSVASSSVLDYDNSVQMENYRNGNISITLVVNTYPFRNFADPSYGGTTVTVSNPLTGFSSSVSFSGTENWGKMYSKTENVGTALDPDGVLMTVTASPDSQGRLRSDGPPISITLQPYGTTDAHANATKRMTDTKLWDEEDTLCITFVGRDSTAITDDYRLMGSAWTQ